MFAGAHIKELKAAVRERRLIIVGGAGLSRAARLPLWRDLIQRQMPAFLRDRGPTGKKIAQTMLAVAKYPLYAAGIWWDWLEHEEGLGTIADFFNKTFLSPTSPTISHRRIAELCQLTGPCIFTTNFDRLFEMASRELVVHTQMDQSLGWLLGPHREGAPKFLLKLHGTAENVESLILTVKQYAQQRERKGYEAFLQAVQLQNTLLFLGYGGRDPDLDQLRNQVVERFQGNVANMYMLLDRPDTGLKESLRKAKVLFSEFDGKKDGYGIVDRVLGLLLAEARKQKRQ